MGSIPLDGVPRGILLGVARHPGVGWGASRGHPGWLLAWVQRNSMVWFSVRESALMGACFSKRGKASSPAEVASNVSLTNNSAVTEEGKKKKPEPPEKSPVITVKKKSSIAEEKDTKEEDIPVKNSSNHEEKEGTKASFPGTGPLRTSSCTREELDAILIQCGRLSRNSSGKATNEMVGSGQPCSKGSRFDDERKEEGGEEEKLESRPSPSRRTPRRERSGSRERGKSGGRRVSRSPGRRTDGGASPASTCDKPRQQHQPAKLISVPATEKCPPFGNAEIEGASLAAERVSTALSSRSRPSANNAVMSNKNAQSQSLSRSSSTKAGQSPYRRDPMTEINENSLTSMFHRSSELDKGVSKSMQPPNIHKPGKAEEAIDEVEKLKQRTVKRRSSHDFDNNPAEYNPIAYTAFLLEDIQKRQNQEQRTVFSFPACVSQACSILETTSDLNSSCSEQRNYELASRGLLVHRSVRDDEPRESAGSNSLDGNPLELLTSVDSHKEVELEDKVLPVESQQQNRSWPEPSREQRSRVSSNSSSFTDTAVKAATPMRKKNQRPLQEARQGVGGGNGEFCRRPISLPVSSTSCRS
ncbi:hypothetical protein KSP39_PZI016693 [Platanthera zijinensis]|uniref:Uncharacterized protein n=1 Tax=Platanthera zijinensis TaxID=2320716 RepID=A0AAP0G0B6_9ASPA